MRRESDSEGEVSEKFLPEQLPMPRLDDCHWSTSFNRPTTNQKSKKKDLHDILMTFDNRHDVGKLVLEFGEQMIKGEGSDTHQV